MESNLSARKIDIKHFLFSEKLSILFQPELKK